MTSNLNFSCFYFIIFREQSLTAECLIEILVRFTLEKRDSYLRQFIHDFQYLKAQVLNIITIFF